jgi:hypothetical protein
MKNVYTLYGKLLSLCLILLGFGACDNSQVLDEYGSPSAKYKVSGKVIANDAQEQPIRNLKVSLTQYNGPENPLTPVLPPITTDANGQFNIEGPAFPLHNFVLQIEDVDGPENGSFSKLTQEIKFQPSDYKGGDGHWYEGEASKDVGTIKLDPEQE